jgi:soluble lytic murein transglycosylase-like protein
LASRLFIAAALAAFGLAGCTTGPDLPSVMHVPEDKPTTVAAGSTELDGLIASYADHYDVPETLVRRVVKRESNFRPEARNGPYYGLMQILPQTARTMGHRGPPSELLDAETNLKYAVKYLRGAYMVAGGDHDQSVRLYARGYYYDAKRKGMLVATGLKPGRVEEPAPTAVADAPPPAATIAANEPVVAFSGSTPSAGAAPMPFPAPMR